MRRLLALVPGLLLAPQLLAATLLVLNKEDATLSLVDPATGRTTASVATGFGPHEVEVSEDGRLAFVTNYGTQQAPGNSLSVIELAARRETRVDLGDLKRPHGVVVRGGSAIFTAEDSRSIGAYDAAAGRVAWRFATEQERTHMVAASADGSLLFTTNMGSNNASIIERRADGSLHQTLVGTGAAPEGMDLSPDGAFLWTSNAGDGSVSIIDVRKKALVRTFDVGTRRSNRLKFTPDGALVLITDLAAGELVVLDAKTQQQRARLPLGRAPCGILIPDATRAYVALAGDAQVAVVDLKSLTVASRISVGRGPDGLAWVP